MIWNEDGAIDYRPALNFDGSDRFTYSVSDGNDASNVATVSLLVTSVNDLPTVNGEAYFVPPGGPLDVPLEARIVGK